MKVTIYDSLRATLNKIFWEKNLRYIFHTNEKILDVKNI